MGKENDYEALGGIKVSLAAMNLWVEEVEYATIAARDAASASYGSAELFKQCRVVETSERYMWNGAAWNPWGVTGGAGAPPSASFVTINAEGDLSAETQHVNILIADRHPPALHAASHENAGADEINVNALSGRLADDQYAGWIKSVEVDDAAIADAKILKYDLASGKLVYVAFPAGTGDMNKVAYDTTATNTKVDTALNAEKLNGQLPAFYAVAGHKDDHKTGGSDAFLLADLHDNVARTQVEKNSVLVGTRRAINFIEGSNINLTVTDDAGSEEVDVNIGVTGGASFQLPTFYTVYEIGGTFWSMDRDGDTTSNANLHTLLISLIDDDVSIWLKKADTGFNLTDDISITSKHRWSIYSDWSAELLQTVANKHIWDLTTCNDVRFFGLHQDCDFRTVTEESHFDIKGCDTVYIEKCWLEDHDYGVRTELSGVTASNNIQVLNCFLDDCGHNNVGFGTSTTNSLVQGCYALKTYAAGAAQENLIDYNNHATILNHGNQFIDNRVNGGQIGISCSGSAASKVYDDLIKGNRIYNVDKATNNHDIALLCTATTVDDNNCRKPAQDGGGNNIYTHATCDSLIITNNQTFGGKVGIGSTGNAITKCIIANNRCRGINSAAGHVSIKTDGGASTNNTVMGNICVDAIETAATDIEVHNVESIAD